ncbi:hypothetical protein DPMN_097565 [Dreissena polymorpha]|uniref:Uncharacterized protein n=1 Tax=Dreissena polymorpha TaxID=45954 RepID=A0A9D4LAH7_DREPO|nr:hypothetical protein DPMN_097565 [Dreissena polymorpha]
MHTTTTTTTTTTTSTTTSTTLPPPPPPPLFTVPISVQNPRWRSPVMQYHLNRMIFRFSEQYIDHDLQMTPIDFEVTRIMKLHGYIDHDSQMTPIDFEVTKSKVKFTITAEASHSTGILNNEVPYRCGTNNIVGVFSHEENY